MHGCKSNFPSWTNQPHLDEVSRNEQGQTDAASFHETDYPKKSVCLLLSLVDADAAAVRVEER